MHGLPSPATTTTSRAGRLRAAVRHARRALLGRQKPDGHWVGELQGDTILESEWVLLMAFLGRERDPRVRAAANYVLRQQQPDGAWSNYPGGPPELSVSVKAYLALKIAGQPADAPHMRRAAGVIRALGGAARCNSFTKFYLALLGQFPYANCPSVPPELVLLPRWFYVNVYAMSSWSRTIFVPLSIVDAHKPVRELPHEMGIRELFLDPPDTPLWPCPPTAKRLSWTNFFLGVDWLWKTVERWGLNPFRGRALRTAAAWMRDHYADSDGLGAIFPPMIYTVIALRCLGVPDDAPEFRWAVQQLDDLMIPEGDTLRLQPCVSPVWDTALTLIGLADAGLPPRAAAVRAGVDWLLAREVRRPGDWSLANPGLEPGGWFFEYRNGFYPDTDDTAMVLMALARRHGGRSRAQLAARHAEPRRRLGRVRPRHRPQGPRAGAVRRPQRHARPELPGHHRPRPGGARPPRVRPGPPAGPAGAGVPPPHPGAARRLAGAVGRQLPLRHLAGLAGAGEDRPAARRPDGPPGGRLAKTSTAAGRVLGRVVPQLRRPESGRGRRADGVADGVGGARPGGGRRGGRPGGAGRGRVAGPDAAGRRDVGRGAVHRHRVPEGVLPEVPLLRAVLPADGGEQIPRGVTVEIHRCASPWA